MALLVWNFHYLSDLYEQCCSLDIPAPLFRDLDCWVGLIPCVLSASLGLYQLPAMIGFSIYIVYLISTFRSESYQSWVRHRTSSQT